MKYELRLSDLVLQSTAKTSIRQRLTVFHRWRRLAFRTFRLRRGEQNELNVEVNAFVGCHEAGKLPRAGHEQLADHPVRALCRG